MRKAALILMVALVALVIISSAFLLMDSDGDGLSNLIEIQMGTAFGNPDTDGDGLSDGAEVITHKTNPLATDTDNDGLNDNVELNVYRTNPLLADTDSDNLSDGLEVTDYSTDPLSADTDNDSINDWSELFTYGTSPLLVDTDNDNLGDYSELYTYGTNPLENDSDNDRLPDSLEVNGWTITLNGSSAGVTSGPLSTDSDGDNLSDWAEYNTYLSNPKSSDTDGDGMSDLLEVLYNTNLSSASSVAQRNENHPSYPRLFLEIDYMPGHAPELEAISYIESYFEYDLGVAVEVVYDDVIDNDDLSAIGVSPATITNQELNTVEAQFHDNTTTHLYVFYASELESTEEGGAAAPTFGVAMNATYLPGRLDRERTILLHEIGHALGMGHTDDSASAMQSGPTFMEPVFASAWSQRNLLDIWSVDEPWT